MVHLYYGDGKGKTTAAMGLALRALAAGRRVCVVQFLKDGTSGEVAMLAETPGATVLSDGDRAKFSFQMSDAERAAARELHDQNVHRAIALVDAGECELVVLDEALDAVNAGLLDQGLLREAVACGHRPADEGAEPVEVVVTGHAPSKRGLPATGCGPDESAFDWLRDHADYVTRMVCEKHPYTSGVTARRGIEF